MFTGIVSGIGRILDTTPLGPSGLHGRRARIQAPPGYLDDVAVGDSIAINGACMTATACDRTAHRFEIDISAQSLACTAGLDRPGAVNLEKALRPTDRLGGHMVTGHVDEVGVVTVLTPAGESHEFRVRASRALAPYLSRKGSIAVHGVSLTINDVIDLTDAVEVTINLIPHTLAHTTLGGLQAGHPVNLEIDLVARYVERMLGPAGAGRAS